MSTERVAAHPHERPTTYSQMLRTWSYRPWKPIVGLIVLLAGTLFIAPLAAMPLLAIGLLIQGDSISERFADALSLDYFSPATMVYLNLSLAGVTLIAWFIVRYIHRLRPRWLTSVKPGIRWKFFFACLGLSLAAIGAQIVVSLFLPGDESGVTTHMNAITGTTVAYALVFLLTTPLQAIGEEYAFRGYAMQAFGSLTRSPWFAILLSALLFALAHGAQNPPLFFDRFLFGLIAGYLVHVTGGLEAGIALHILNNLFAFGIGLMFGDVEELLKSSEASWWNIPLTLTQNLVYLALVLLIARRMNLDPRTSPPPAGEGDPVLVEAEPTR